MKIAHIDTARKSVGPKNIEVLTDIFRTSQGTPPGVPAARYRVNHRQWMDTLDELSNGQLFLKRSRTGSNYELRLFALPLIQDTRAEILLGLMEQIFYALQRSYERHLTEMQPLSEIVSAISGTSDDIRAAFYYLTDASGVWSGLSSDFPYGDDPKIGVAESVLRYPDCGRLFDEFYEWHIINPKSQADTWMNAALHMTSDGEGGFFSRHEAEKPPDWYMQLDDMKKALISELDKAVGAGMAALPTMGLRTLLESVMRDHVGEKKSFAEYLVAFRNAGYVTNQHADLIEKVVDAGHASIHRAYFPNRSDLDTCVEVVKHLMHGVYVLKPKVDAVAENTPPKTARRIKEDGQT